MQLSGIQVTVGTLDDSELPVDHGNEKGGQAAGQENNWNDHPGSINWKSGITSLLIFTCNMLIIRQKTVFRSFFIDRKAMVSLVVELRIDVNQGNKRFQPAGPVGMIDGAIACVTTGAWSGQWIRIFPQDCRSGCGRSATGFSLLWNRAGHRQ